MRRARLVGAAENKMVELERLLERRKVDRHSLFYCSDGRTIVDDDDDHAGGSSQAEMKQRHAVAQTLLRRGVSVSPFTSDENRWQRREILRRFKDGETEAMVAIRCLDEGIDVPACRTAYLIASSRNPRQFIQRRGRILRRSPGKNFATIFDFVVVMPEGHTAVEEKAGDFLKNELGRVADFARNSLYPASSIEPLLPWLSRVLVTAAEAAAARSDPERTALVVVSDLRLVTPDGPAEGGRMRVVHPWSPMPDSLDPVSYWHTLSTHGPERHDG